MSHLSVIAVSLGLLGAASAFAPVNPLARPGTVASPVASIGKPEAAIPNLLSSFAGHPEACFVPAIGGSGLKRMPTLSRKSMCSFRKPAFCGAKMMSSDASAVPKDVTAAMKKLFSSSDESATFRVAELNKLKEEGVLSKWNSAQLKSRPVSQNELKRVVKSELELDELMGLKAADPDLKGLTVAAFGASAVIGVGGSLIGGETGGLVYWITYLGASIPLVLIGVGSVAPGIIGDVISKIKWQFDPTNTLERRVRHEAAHMLCGYLCGLPVQGYQVEPEPLCQFFDRQEGNIDDIEKWKMPRPFSRSEIDVLSVVSLSGLMGELTKFESAEGGQQDLLNLQNFFFRAEGDTFRKPQVKEGQTRWGALTSRQLLDDNKDSFERLCNAMTNKKTVEECIAAIEG